MKFALANLIRNAGVAPLLVFLVIAFFVPVAMVLSLAVWSPADGFSLASLRRIVVTPIYSTTLLRTLEISLWTTVMCLLGGFPIALLINRLRCGPHQSVSTGFAAFMDEFPGEVFRLDGTAG
jgi:ABC-type spermidine/putrescine transport system permease subunit I